MVFYPISTITSIILAIIIILSIYLNIPAINKSFYIGPLRQVEPDHNSNNNNNNTININNGSFIGVDIRGIYTSIAQAREGLERSKLPIPENYYEHSFRLIANAGMNHVRYVFYWEAYEKDPYSFVKELNIVANTADRYGIKVLYDNHQSRTSSWLNPKGGTGFPWTLFENRSDLYPYGGGGGPRSLPAMSWWSNWWNRSVKDIYKTDGWILQAEFLKSIVKAVDNHTSTLGYEILNEPQVSNKDQWDKIGKYNTFMVNELRKVTQKTIAYSMNIPVDLTSPINNNPENLAKMAPANTTNIVFKISQYGMPFPNTYHGKRLDNFIRAGQLAGVPLYVGEWNQLSRDRVINEGQAVFVINPKTSDISEDQIKLYIQKFKDMKVWGWAFWLWNFKPHEVVNYNLISIREDGKIQPTKYLEYLRNGISNAYRK